MATNRNVLNLYNFSESRFTALSHELRVYIFGADVTPWLTGDLSVTYGNRDSFNTVTFELANPRRLWQLSRANLEGKWRETIGEYSEREKLKVFRWKNSTLVNPFFMLNIDTQILGNRGDVEPNSGPGSTTFVAPSDNAERRYRLAVNDCVFSRQDPLRVFLRNPYSPGSDEWVEIFCGFVNDHPVTTNYLTGESTVRISGYCIRHLLTKMRVQLNRLVVSGDNQPLFQKDFFSDFLKPSYGNHPFLKTSLEKTIKELILGTASPTTGEAAHVASGLGDFKMGNVICYDANGPENTLERWHLMTIFGVNKVPFPNGATDDLWLTKSEMDDIGRATIHLPETFGQGPGGRYLHFLLPKGGTGAGALVQGTLDSSNYKAIEWTTRWEIIRDFASKLDFQVTTSPSGDILVEFPLYGFTPHVFSTYGGLINPNLPQTEEQQQVLSDINKDDKAAMEKASKASDFVTQANLRQKEANDLSVAKVKDDIEKGTIPSGLGAIFTFELHQLEDTLNDEAEDFDTILQVDGGMSFTQENVPNNSEFTNLRAYIYSPVLVGRFGVVMGQMQIPYAGQRSADMASTDGNAAKDSAIAKRIAKLALIEYTKRLADASTWDGSVVYRPFLFPNRPVWLKRSCRMGLLTSVTNRWSIGKSAGTNLAMHMLMSERYSNNTTEYRLPTGASNMPIDYKNIWDDSDPTITGSLTSGVFAVVGTKTAPTTDANGGAGAVGSGKPAPASSSKSPFSVGYGKDINIPYNDPTFMYTPFSDAISKALEQAKAANFPAITIQSTYRSPERQLYLRQHPEARAKKANGDPVGANEPWKSLHQYGMAIDISIAGNNLGDYQRFAQICGENILWKIGDHVHYEWRSPAMPGSDKTNIQANKFRKAAGFGDDQTSTMTQQRQAAAASGSGSGAAAAAKGSYLQAVWKQFAAIEQQAVKLQDAATPPTGVIASVKSFFSSNERTQSTGTGEATAPEECAFAPLSTSGMAEIKEIAAKLAAAITEPTEG